MLIYVLMFALPAFAVFFPYHGTQSLTRLAWWIVGLLFTVLIGFRYQVGGDWETYLQHYEAAINVPFSEAVVTSDPGYAVLNWLSGLFGTEVYMVNLICGAIVMLGIIIFSRRQPLPWVAFLVSVPYMIVVVAMGYTRQGVALGFELLALVAVFDRQFLRFLLFVLLGGLFHKTAFMLLPFGLLISIRHDRLWLSFLMAGIGLWIGLMLVIESYDAMWQNYVAAQMQSDGGPVRVAMNAVPAILLLSFRKKLMPTDQGERRIWILMSVFSILCVPLVGLASTAVDRIALYFMPLQLYVFSRLHLLFHERLFKTVAVVSVVMLYSFVLWTWLNFATYAFAWLPYQLWPFVE